jgi:16S rRNA (guanine966-N2)-methyltransferase
MRVERGGRGWVRVIAGRHRGLRLSTVPGRDVRPTADRVRESMFGILGERVVGARVLDCFAGTGALGIEALSRGAAGAVFVENDPRVLLVLRQNLERLDPGETRVVVGGDALTPQNWRERGFPARLVFADPPYRRGLALAFLDRLAAVGAVGAESLVLVEHERELVLAHPAWTPVDRRQYGDTAITFLTWREKEHAA